MRTGGGDFDDLPVQPLDQRTVLRFGVADDNVIVGDEKDVGDLALGCKGFAAAGCAENQTIGVFVKRNFLGAGKSYMIKGKQAEKKAENALCGRLKCVLVAGNIKPLPTSEKRLRQG